MNAFREWMVQLYAHLGYPQIILLMTMESSLLPVPSELVMIPAGYLAHAGQLNAGFAIVCGAFGSLLGATANYWIGRTLGQAFLLRYGRYLLIDKEKYLQAEALFMSNSHRATFFGRFLPVIRHLISLPAGVFRMRGVSFALLTAMGSALWCSVLAACGYYFGESAVQVVTHYTHELGLLSVALLIVGTIWFLRRKK